MPATTRKYCGTSATLPVGYTAFDDRYSCLRKGFGVAKGKYGEAQQCRMNYKLFVVAIILLVIALILTILYIVWYCYKKEDEKEE